MAIIKCKMCGGTLEITPGASVGVCEYCGSQQTLPRLDSDRKATLYDRASHFRRSNDFDKAMAVYELLLNEDLTDAEAYWSIVLCRYGIEYVEDPRTHRRIPTINRAQYTSILTDEDYKQAIVHADAYQRGIYEEEAQTIDRIQKGILDISSKEDPFDVFICYKETDEHGRRTPDSVYAQEIYNALTTEGYKVFFARITLEDKLGSAYEPYIFAALNSAKVMIAIGTKAEYFNAVWVKNEWSRYLNLVKAGKGKTLIPAYRDMNPYDMPEEFAYLQSQDMGKLGYLQDLVRGVKKLCPQPQMQARPKGNTELTAPLLRRAAMFLDKEDWKRADDIFEQTLNFEPENAEAYVGKLLAEFHLKDRPALAAREIPFDDNENYQFALLYADDALRAELTGYIDQINERNEAKRKNGIYTEAATQLKSATTVDDVQKAQAQFASLEGWRDSDDKIKECLRKIEKIQAEEARRRAEAKERARRTRKTVIKVTSILCAVAVLAVGAGYLWTNVITPNRQYKAAKALYDAGDYLAAADAFDGMGDYKNASQQAQLAMTAWEEAEAARLLAEKAAAYAEAEALLTAGDMEGAAEAFAALRDYKDAADRAEALLAELAPPTVEIPQRRRNVLATTSYGGGAVAGILPNGTVVWSEHTPSAIYDSMAEWTDIVEIDGGDQHFVGLRPDGTVVAAGVNEYGQCDVSSWRDIISISASGIHTVGLRADGTVVSTNVGYPGYDVSEWTDVVDIAAGNGFTAALLSDGTIVDTGLNIRGQRKVSMLENITDIFIAADNDNDVFTINADGILTSRMVLRTNKLRTLLTNPDLVSVTAVEWQKYIGLRSDGSVVISTALNNTFNMYSKRVEEWANIVDVKGSPRVLIGLRSDGKVEYITTSHELDRALENWPEIRLPTA